MGNLGSLGYRKKRNIKRRTHLWTSFVAHRNRRGHFSTRIHQGNWFLRSPTYLESSNLTDVSLISDTKSFRTFRKRESRSHSKNSNCKRWETIWAMEFSCIYQKKSWLMKVRYKESTKWHETKMEEREAMILVAATAVPGPRVVLSQYSETLQESTLHGTNSSR